uniref:Wu:fj16a03 n=1 Tax=Oncorhynchus kisutch TaxID=8019 RepID=A0A8C7C7K4_ONCKI
MASYVNFNIDLFCNRSDYKIECYGEDFLMLRNQLLQCSSKTQQACYTRKTGEKGCARLEFCSRPGWKCCYKDRCNALS